MTGKSDDWAKLQAAWKAQPSETESNARYRERLRKERRREFIEAVFETLMSLACACVFAWWALKLDGVERIILAALAVAALSYIPITFFLRRSVWFAHRSTITDHALFLRQHAQRGLWFARVGYVGGPLGLVLGVTLSHLGDFTALKAMVDPKLAFIAVLALAAVWLWSFRQAGRWRCILTGLEARDHIDTIEEA